MGTLLHFLEDFVIKQDLARLAFCVNGFFELFAWLALVHFPWIIFGYILLWAYWLETKTTDENSLWRWLASLLYNLCLLLIFISQNGLSLPTGFLLGGCWLVLMVFVSLIASVQVFKKVGTA